MALIVSALSGYFAMLAGQTTQLMLASEDSNVRISGILSIIIAFMFILYYFWKGGSRVLRHVVLPVLAVVILIGAVGYFSGWGSGLGMFYLGLSMILVTVMLIVGTIARTTAGTLSNLVFIVVALAGSLFSKNLGGGIGTMVLAIACGLISKKAFKDSEKYSLLSQVSTYITRKFGTSFRGSKLTGGNFSKSVIRNADFTNADISSVNWAGSKKNNCII
jgi:prepilin signal peptidase PulO-like enzyme (type II secretory pathway)